jgi:hypothetical protein
MDGLMKLLSASPPPASRSLLPIKITQDIGHHPIPVRKGSIYKYHRFSCCYVPWNAYLGVISAKCFFLPLLQEENPKRKQKSPQLRPRLYSLLPAGYPIWQ